MSDYGLKISLPGKNVRNAQRGELSVDSNKDSLKVDTIIEPPRFGSFKFNVNVVAAQDRVIKEVEHNLGFKPHVLAHFIRQSEGNYGLLPYILTDDSAFYYQLTITATDRKVIFTWFTNPVSMALHTGPETFDVRYYIFSNKPKEL